MLEAEKKDCVRAPAFGVAYVPKEVALCIGFDHLNILPTFKIVVENIGEHYIACSLIGTEQRNFNINIYLHSVGKRLTAMCLLAVSNP